MRVLLPALLLLWPLSVQAVDWDWGNWPWTERQLDREAPPLLSPPSTSSLPETRPAPPAPKVPRYKVPPFDGKARDFRAPVPLMEPLVQVDSDALFQVVRDCFPEYVSWGIDVSAIAGARYSDDGLFVSVNGTEQSALSKYWVGIVARMPLYSAAEINRERAEELRRRESIASNIQALVKALSDRRRAQRELGYYAGLEARAGVRVDMGIAETAEQVGFAEKVNAAMNKLDEARATIDGARIALVGQCRDEVRASVNSYLLEVVR